MAEQPATSRWRVAAGLPWLSLAATLALAASAQRAGGLRRATGTAGAWPPTRSSDKAADDAARRARRAAQPAAPNGGPAPGAQVGARTSASVIYTGSMTVRVDDVTSPPTGPAASPPARAGSSAPTSARSTASSPRHSSMLRVPADKFDQALDELAKLGKEESRAGADRRTSPRSWSTSTPAWSPQQASVDRVRALLAKAETIGEVVSVESELARREADLASLQARKRRLTDKVDLSTITVCLLGPAAPSPKPEKDETGFLAGLKGGWKAFLASIQVVLTILGG